jgi:hypothetical protein
MKISRTLYDKLSPHLEQGQDINLLLAELMFEVPDESMDRYMALQDLVEVEVSEATAAIASSMAKDFGLTVEGLSALLADIHTKVQTVLKRFESYVARYEKTAS